MFICGGDFNQNIRKLTKYTETDLNINKENEYTYNKKTQKSELDFILTNTKILD
jgi:hypothetical protein